MRLTPDRAAPAVAPATLRGRAQGVVAETSQASTAAVDSLTLAKVAPSASPTAAPKMLADLFAAVPAGTAWKDLEAPVRRALETTRQEELARFATAWGPAGLAAKRHALSDAPTQELAHAVDAYVHAAFGNALPAGTELSTVEPPALRQALRDVFLAQVAQGRAMAASYAATPSDWDGQPLTDFPLPSAEALDASQSLAHRATLQLRALLSTLTDPIAKGLAEAAEPRATALSTGSFGGVGYGGEDLRTPYGRAAWGFDLLGSGGPQGLYSARPEDFLRAATAYWLEPATANVNASTVASTLSYGLPSCVGPDAVRAALGDPATSTVSKAFNLLTQWYGERLAAEPGAAQKSQTLPAPEQARMWESFQADSAVHPSERLTLPQFEAALAARTDELRARGQEVAKAVLTQLFPAGSPELTDAQRTHALAALAARPVVTGVGAALRAALEGAGSPAAAAKLQAALDAQPQVGGVAPGSPIPPATAAELQGMWQDVRAYLGRHYARGTKSLEDFLPPSLSLAIGTGTQTDTQGNITFDVQTRLPKATAYGMMLHEAKHAIDFRSGQAAYIQGAAWEGAAELVQNRVTPGFLAELPSQDPTSLALAQTSLLESEAVGIADAQATLAMLTTPRGGDLEAATNARLAPFGGSYASVVARAFNGLQDLNYAAGQLVYASLLDWLQAQLGPTPHPLDPYLLQLYGVESAGKDAATVANLKAALAASP